MKKTQKKIINLINKIYSVSSEMFYEVAESFQVFNRDGRISKQK